MTTITVLPGNTSIKVDSEANLRDVLIKAGHPIKSTCGGCASCGTCVVVVLEGGDNLSEVSFEEKQLLGNVFHITSERLSCQTKVLGDITVDIGIHKEEQKPAVTKRRTKEEKHQILSDRKENMKDKPIKQGGKKRPKAFTTKE